MPLTATGLLSDRGSRGRWLCVPGLIAFTALVSSSGKATIRRPRPGLGYGSPPIGRFGLASSFPSTNAACGFAIASWLRHSRQRNWLHLLAAAIGYARVRRRAHHLLDVLAGGAMGYAIGRAADATWEALRVGIGRAFAAAVVIAVLAGGGAKSAWAVPPTISAEMPPTETRYATVHRVCPPPAPGDASCFALALVPAPAGAADVLPYAVGAGSSSSGPAGGLTPADLASAYSFSPAVGGAGQTVAVVDAYDDPNIEADLGTFDSRYGLPACTTSNGCYEKVGQTGSTTALPPADTIGWSLETSLDVETVHSACENCKVLLVEADSPSLANLAVAANEAVTLGASEVSNSYGALESETGESEQAAYNHPGVVITASAGDSGYLSWDEVAAFLPAPAMPNAPASLPTVVAVGGTSLTLKANGTRRKESVWNDSGRPSHKEFKQFSATGGGCSTLFSAPEWQTSAQNWASNACGDKRLDNDIAGVADPYTGFDVYDSYIYEPGFKPGWLTMGGTSLATPLISALYGLAGGSHGVNYPASTLYKHLGEASALYDVTNGGSGYCDGEAPGPCGEPAINQELGDVDCEGTTACDAAPGFDGPSGVGTPNGLKALGGPPQTKPTVVTEPASSVTTTSAILNATVNPNGEVLSTCLFEYGSTTSYGKSAPCSIPPGSGTNPVTVSATITGLIAKSRYHYRITASSPYGKSTGKSKALKTT